LIYPYVKNPQIYACPASTTAPAYNPVAMYGTSGPGPFVTSDYQENACLGEGPNGPGCSSLPQGYYVTLIQGQIYQPARMVMLKAMSSSGWMYSANPDYSITYLTVCGDMSNPACCANSWECPNTETRHNNGGNVAYCDGHAKWLSNAVLFATDATDLLMWNNSP
jgi:prepilin-type processing-associated H-X9-DG protein